MREKKKWLLGSKDRLTVADWPEPVNLILQSAAGYGPLAVSQAGTLKGGRSSSRHAIQNGSVSSATGGERCWHLDYTPKSGTEMKARCVSVRWCMCVFQVSRITVVVREL